MNTHETLVAARNLIDREGWTQGLRGYIGKVAPDVGGPFCALGAISAIHAGEHSGRVSPATKAFLAALGRDDNLAEWNDAPERTKEEVLAAFDKAIAATAPEPADPLSGVVPMVEARASFREMAA